MKKTNNKGFSLVELIVVVAIMAVLMVVVGPQLLRYVERTRIQRDNTAIAEIANAAKIAMADETINKAALPTDGKIVATTGTITFGSTAIEKELIAVLGDKIVLQSTAYQTGNPGIVVTKDATTGVVTITSTGLKNQDGSEMATQITY